MSNHSVFKQVVMGFALTGIVAFLPVAQAQDVEEQGLQTELSMSDTDGLEYPGNPHTFRLTELSGMVKLPESDDYAVMLTDGSFDRENREMQPSLIITSSDSEGNSATDLDMDLELFAAVMMYLNEELFKSIKVKDTSLLTIADLPSAEVLAKAKGVETGEKLQVVQWMLFSSDGKFVKILAYAPRDDFEAALPRFKAIRDGMIVGP